jgi:hypothetical protein
VREKRQVTGRYAYAGFDSYSTGGGNGLPSEQAEHAAMVALVDRILKAKRTDAAADTAALEREIGERVYRLYGLTAEEIKIVEEASQR